MSTAAYSNTKIEAVVSAPTRNLEWRERLIVKALEHERESVKKRTCAEISGDDEATAQSMDCILVPCLAKGMPVDHTLETAYFLIPADIRHGTDLVCSHAKCRDAGAKFRYCQYCSGPVIRRNFSTRHNHSTQVDSIREKEESDTRAMYGIPDQVTTKKAKHSSGNSSDDNGSSSASSKGEPSEFSFAITATSIVAATATAKLPERAKSTTTTCASSPALDSTPTAKDACGQDETTISLPSVAVAVSSGDATGVLGDQEQQLSFQDDDTDSLASDVSADVKRHFIWATLLAKRPRSNDESDMSKWLMEVLSVSDGHDRLRSAADSSPTTDSSGNEKGEMPTDQSGTAGTSRTDGSSNESVDTPVINKSFDATPTDRSSNSNESSNDSSSEDMRTEND